MAKANNLNDLYVQVDNMSPELAKIMIKDLLNIWFVEDDGTFYLDKELDSHHIAEVTQLLSNNGLY